MFVPQVWPRGPEQAEIVGLVINPNLANKYRFLAITSMFLTSVLVFSDSKRKNHNVQVRFVHKVRNSRECKLLASPNHHFGKKLYHGKKIILMVRN